MRTEQNLNMTKDKTIDISLPGSSGAMAYKNSISDTTNGGSGQNWQGENKNLVRDRSEKNVVE